MPFQVIMVGAYFIKAGLLEDKHDNPINPLAPGRCGNNNKNVMSKQIWQIKLHAHFLWNCSKGNTTEHFWW